MIIKSKIPGIVWFVFNITFISFIQSILLFLFSCAPAYAILLSTKLEPKVGTADIAFFLIEVGLVLSEWISDGQQWSMPAHGVVREFGLTDF